MVIILDVIQKQKNVLEQRKSSKNFIGKQI